MFLQECATIASVIISEMDGPTAMTFVAEFGLVGITPELSPLREALFNVMRKQLRSITQYPWADPEKVPGTPKELLLAIQSPNATAPLIPGHMFVWIWPFLREHIMVNWFPSLAVTMHHFIQTPEEASEHWDIILTASLEAEIITKVIVETRTEDDNAEVDRDIVDFSLEYLKTWEISSEKDRINYGHIKTVMEFNPFMFVRKQNIVSENTHV
jgi:hypothetical protein